MANLGRNDKSLLHYFEEKCSRIAESTSDGINYFESDYEKQERIARLLKDYDAFCQYYFPLYCKAPAATFHVRENKYADRHWNEVILWQWYRGFAKSTHANLLRPMFLYFNKKLQGMVLVSNNFDLASRLLFDVKANFEYNKRIINDFGDLKSFGNWSDGFFATSDDVAFWAFGKEQTVRGTKFKGRRPNYASVDDLQKKQELKNDQLTHEDYEFIKEDVIPALDDDNWQLIIPQNKFHKNTLTAKFEADPEIKVHVSRVNALNDQGRTNWPENRSKSTEKLLAKKKSMGNISWSRENNEPIEEGKIFRKDMIHWEKRLPFNHYDFLLCYTDPSYKNNQKSDYKALAFIGKKGRKVMVFRARVRKTGIKQMFLWNYEMDELVGDPGAISHWMEANFIQDMHLRELEPLADEKKRRLRLSGDYRQKPDKFQRVSSMEPLFENVEVVFDATQKDDPDMLLAIAQLTAFEKGSNMNDDFPDALESAISKIEELTVTSVPPSYIPKSRSRHAY